MRTATSGRTGIAQVCFELEKKVNVGDADAVSPEQRLANGLPGQRYVVLEIRSYILRPGTRDTFHRLVATESVPLLQLAGTDVIAFGPSLHDAESYFLMRAYRDLRHLQKSQDNFYGSAAWRTGPRQAIVALILHDLNAVLWVSQGAADAMRQVRRPTRGLFERAEPSHAEIPS